jgi:methionine synthase II (cobalamin-independent)
MPKSSARCYGHQHSAWRSRGSTSQATQDPRRGALEDRTALRELEDSAIRDAVRRQIDLVWDVVTDGEPRRCMLLSLPTKPIG